MRMVLERSGGQVLALLEMVDVVAPRLAAEGVVYASSGIRRYPEAAALIRKLMRERGLATASTLTRRSSAAATSTGARAPSATSTRWKATPCPRRSLDPRSSGASPDRRRTRWCRPCAPRPDRIPAVVLAAFGIVYEPSAEDVC